MRTRSVCPFRRAISRMAVTSVLLSILGTCTVLLCIHEGRLHVRTGTINVTWPLSENARSEHSWQEHVSGKESVGPDGEVTEGVGGWFNSPDCSVMELLARPDPSVTRAYNHSALCGPTVRDRDVFCVQFFLQNDLKDDGDCVRPCDDNQVPRIVYYVIFGNYTFHFWHYVSVMAAKRHVAPSALYVIGDTHPLGYWWQRVLQDCTGVRFIYRPCPGTINGQKVIFPHHWSDIVRLQALLLNGGIYLDLDMILTRDPEPLLAHDITMGLVENVTGVGNAFIAAKRNSAFIREWYEHYNQFSNSLDRYFYNSLKVPWEMWRQHPERLHLESERLYRPNYFEADKLFKGWDYDWTQNYAVHVWTNGNTVPSSEEEIRTSNTTIAQVFRNALYGDPAPRPSRRS